MGASHHTVLSIFRRRLHRFQSDRGGATIVEYALIVALIGTSLIATFESFEGEVDDMFVYVGDTVEATEAP